MDGEESKSNYKISKTKARSSPNLYPDGKERKPFTTVTKTRESSQKQKENYQPKDNTNTQSFNTWSELGFEHAIPLASQYFSHWLQLIRLYDTLKYLYHFKRQLEKCGINQTGSRK